MERHIAHTLFQILNHNNIFVFFSMLRICVCYVVCARVNAVAYFCALFTMQVRLVKTLGGVCRIVAHIQHIFPIPTSYNTYVRHTRYRWIGMFCENIHARIVDVCRYRCRFCCPHIVSYRIASSYMLRVWQSYEKVFRFLTIFLIDGDIVVVNLF